MEVIVKKAEKSNILEMIEIWNEIVESGFAFPQEEKLDAESGEEFFNSQTYCGVAIDNESKKVVGLYILHPNNVGRCGHICNASYAVKSDLRNIHIGEKLVKDCLKKGREFNFKILQFNAVVKTNYSAHHLYKKLGFKKIGVVPNGFRLKSGNFEDIVLYYNEL